MIRLDKALLAWGTPAFEDILKQEISLLGTEHLPLQQGLSGGNYVSGDPVTVMIKNITEHEHVISISAGIFYMGVLGGCSCSDDPTQASDINEYCEVQLVIDKRTAVTVVTLLD